MKYAFFDVDNTIYNGYSGSELIDYLLETEPNADILQRMNQGIESYHQRKIAYHDVSQLILDLVSETVKGKHQSEMKPLVQAMLSKKPQVYFEWVEECMAYLKDNQYQIVLVSAGPDLAIAEVAEQLQADAWYATGIEHDAGIYTGNPTQLLNEIEKSKVIDTLLANEAVSHSIAFGDSLGDIPMLERVDSAFVVANDHHHEMIEHAKKTDWLVFSAFNEVKKRLAL